MTEDDKRPESEKQPEEFKTFRSAKKQAIIVRRIDLANGPPKMFREHKPIEKTNAEEESEEAGAIHGPWTIS